MFAILSSLVFSGAALVALFAVAATFHQSRERIADALQGVTL